MVTVIASACSAFGLTVSDAKTNIMCLQSNGEGHVPFTVTAAGQVYNQTVEFVCLGGAISADWDLRSVESRGHGRDSDGIRWKSMTVRVSVYA